MTNDTPVPPARSFEIQINMPAVGQIPETLANAFTSSSAEAQMLEHALKGAITKDVQVFAESGDQVSFLEILERVTLGQAKDIAVGTSTKKGHKEIAACIGFYAFVKMQWHVSGRSEAELTGLLKDSIARRNRIAHALLAEVFSKQLSTIDALDYLEESKHKFLELRALVVTADTLSSKMGSIATDGSSQSRFKTTT